MQEKNSSMFIALTGLPGSGKTTLGRCLDSETPSNIDPGFSEHFTNVRTLPMRWLLAQHGYTGDNTIAGLQTFHQNLRDTNQSERVFDSLHNIHESIVIIDAVRNIKDMKYLKHTFNAFTIGLDIPIHLARERFMNDQDDDKHRHSFELFGQNIEGNLTTQERKILARERAWDQAIVEAGDNPNEYECVQEADTKIYIDEKIGFGQVAVTAKKYIRDFISQRLEHGYSAHNTLVDQSPIASPTLI